MLPPGQVPVWSDTQTPATSAITVAVWSNAQLAGEPLQRLTEWRRDQYLSCGFYDPDVVMSSGWIEGELDRQRPDDQNVTATDASGELLLAAALRQPEALPTNVSFMDPDRPDFPNEEIHGRAWMSDFHQLHTIDASDVWEIGRLVRDQDRRDPTMRRAALTLAIAAAQYLTDPSNQHKFRLLVGDLDPTVALGLFYALDAPVVTGPARTVQLPKGHALAPRYANAVTTPFLVDLRDSGYASSTRWREISKVVESPDDELEGALAAFRTKVASIAPRPSRLAAAPPPSDPDAFYEEFVTRNKPLFTDEVQRALRAAHIIIAGCGSTGGACGMPLLRSGATKFSIFDPGTFELNNFNRQEATIDDLGRNKAVVLAERMHGVNPHADIEIYPEGVVPNDIDRHMQRATLVIDAIDVTTRSGMDAKLALHRSAVQARTPVINGLRHCNASVHRDLRLSQAS